VLGGEGSVERGRGERRQDRGGILRRKVGAEAAELGDPVDSRLGAGAVASHAGRECFAQFGFDAGSGLQRADDVAAAFGQLPGDLDLEREDLHNAVFTLNLLAVGGALLGLGRAAGLAGLVPRWMTPLSVGGAALLAVAATPAVAEVHGSNLVALGLIGFVCWLVLLATAGVQLVRTR